MSRLSALLALVLLSAIALTTLPASASELAAVQGQRAGFPVTLDTGRVNFGSVTIADLGDGGRPEILVGSETGLLYALNADGSRRWTYNVGAAINAAAAGQPRLVSSTKPIAIRSAPTVADVTGDGVPEIFVGAGDVTAAQTHGGVAGITAGGQTLPGWPQVSCNLDAGSPPTSFTPMTSCAQLNGSDGYADGVVSSPAVGDITGDGKPEIVYGSFDQFTYARRPDGSLLPGWPQHALDTIWASPSLADLTGDGVNEVVIGVDAHFYRGPSYNGVRRETLDGGYMMAYGGDGTILWAAHQDEIFQSSPAVADLDGDGRPEIAAGTGSYFGRGRYFTVWNHDGSVLWRTLLPAQVEGAPAIGDVTGDAGLEVVVGALDGKVYVFDGATGAIRWSTLARDIFNNQFNSQPKVFSPVLADYTGDGRDDVFVSFAWDVLVMRGTDGALLTGTAPESSAPSYYTDYTVNSTPALGDLDGDGKLELVAASGTLPNTAAQAKVSSWDLPTASGRASWPMLRHDPAHTGRLAPKILRSSVSSIGGLLTPGQTRSFTIAISAADGAALSWSASKGGLQNVSVSLSRTSGDQNDTLRITIDPGSSGSFSGTVTLSASGYPSVEIPISGKVVNNVEELYLPLLTR